MWNSKDVLLSVVLKNLFQKMVLFTSRSFKASLLVSLGSGFVQIEILILIDETMSFFFVLPHIQIDMHTGDGLITLAHWDSREPPFMSFQWNLLWFYPLNSLQLMFIS